MTATPEISVVMGVYNGADLLEDTIESVLGQSQESFEYIIVDDGSVDGTEAVLSTFQKRDPRIRVVAQSNQGLTCALVTGCSLARGQFIARQDCGDISLPDRLQTQQDVLEKAPNCVMVSCGTQYVGPEGDHLYDVTQTTAKLQAGLSNLTADKVRGPSHHGSTLFRRDAYEQVGGYRTLFKVAQDLDLWLRLWEVGDVQVIPDVLYQAKWLPGGISSTNRHAQIEAADTILSCAIARRNGQDETRYLRDYKVKAPAANRNMAVRRLDEAKFNYFVAGNLRQSQPGRSRYYYAKAIRASKLYLPAWFGMVRTLIRR